MQTASDVISLAASFGFAAILTRAGKTAEFVCVTAQKATKKGARGGVKLTGFTNDGRVVDEVIDARGNPAHGPHGKGPYDIDDIPLPW